MNSYRLLSGRALGVLLFVVFLCAGAGAQAQGPYAQAWVDPCNGSDATGAVAFAGAPNPGLPFQTINAAITALLFCGCMQNNEGVVWAMPGIYSPATNGETLPINLVPPIHLIAAGDAKETVIRDDAGNQSTSVFLPKPPMGMVQNRSVLMVADGPFFNAATDVSVTGFTFQGGDVQVYMGPFPLGGNLRISNCIFDLREGVYATDPDFGILAVSRYVGPAFNNYIPWNARILNNTFIQGRVDNGNATQPFENAAMSNVALCDVNQPFSGGITDPNPTLRGVGNHMVHNNLFRNLNSLVSMIGIDDSDTQVMVGSQLGASNAFVAGSASNTDAANCYQSNITGNVPAPRVALDPNTGGADPAFVGEHFSAFNLLGSNLDDLDFRRLPGDALQDMGTGLDFNVNPGLGTLTAMNGITYTEPAGMNPPHRVFHFTWDGEGYGNPRAVGQPDIGYDENDIFLVGGSYANNSRSHDTACDCGIGAGGIERRMIFPGAGGISLLAAALPYATPVSWVNPPTTIEPGILYPGVGTLWIDPNQVIVVPSNVIDPNVSPTALVPIPLGAYLNPINGAIHLFGEITWMIGDGGFCSDFAQQVAYFPAGGFPSVLSNLQFERF